MKKRKVQLYVRTTNALQPTPKANATRAPQTPQAASRRLIPRPRIAHRAPARALTRAPKLLRQILRRDLLQQRLLIPAPQDIDLLHRHLVQPRPDNRPHRAERPRRVDDIELAHRLRVPILPDGRRRGDVVLDAVEVAERDAAEVEDRAVRLDGVSERRGARGQARGLRLLVLVDEPLELALLRRDRVERFDVELAEALDVERAPVLGLRTQMSRASKG
jgi:hypothetical protein